MFPSKFISVFRIKELNITYMINDSERLTEKLAEREVKPYGGSKVG